MSSQKIIPKHQVTVELEAFAVTKNISLLVKESPSTFLSMSKPGVMLLSGANGFGMVSDASGPPTWSNSIPLSFIMPFPFTQIRFLILQAPVLYPFVSLSVPHLICRSFRGRANG